jgi:1,4-alpha-glucan branching enzyme
MNPQIYEDKEHSLETQWERREEKKIVGSEAHSSTFERMRWSPRTDADGMVTGTFQTARKYISL